MKKIKRITKIFFCLFVARFLAHAIVIAETQINTIVSNKLNAAIDVVATKYGYEIPRPEIDEIDYQRIAEREALRAGINPSLVRAKIKVESGWNPKIISPAGAIGLMQVMPANAKRCGLEPRELLEPEKNIRCGLKIFAEDMKATNNNVVKALYRYNGGPRAVNNPPAESLKHAVLVLSETAKDIRG